MSDREPLSGTDNAWRRMGNANNLMVITGVLMFDGTLTYDELCDRLESRLLRFKRFSQHIEGTNRRLLRPYWTDTEGFDIHNHVYDLRLPEPGDQETFERFVGTLMSRPLDESRPLWEVYLMGDAGPGDGNSVVVRINHCVGDGFALLYVLLGLVDNPEELEFPIGGVSAPPAPPDESDSTDGTSADAQANGGTAVQADNDDQFPSTQAQATETDGVDEMRDEMTPSGPLEKVGATAKAVKTAYDLLTMPDEPETSLYGKHGQTKRAAWTRRIDLERVKEIGYAHDATINDVLMAVAAGAIRRVLEDRGEETTGLELRCTMPVNLKPMDARDESLGNYFGVVFAPLPVGIEDLNERIDAVHDEMDVQKAGIQAFLMYKVVSLFGRTPASFQNFAMDLFEKQATGVVTNVPGPSNTAKFAGKEVTDMVFWVPQGNDQGLGISIISYDGSVRIGIAADANLLPEPNHMADAFEREIDELFADLDI